MFKFIITILIIKYNYIIIVNNFYFKLNYNKITKLILLKTLFLQNTIAMYFIQFFIQN